MFSYQTLRALSDNVAGKPSLPSQAGDATLKNANVQNRQWTMAGSSRSLEFSPSEFSIGAASAPGSSRGIKQFYRTDLKCKMDSNSKPWGGLRNEGSLLVLAGRRLAGKTVEPLNWTRWQAEQKACVLYQAQSLFSLAECIAHSFGDLSILSVIQSRSEKAWGIPAFGWTSLQASLTGSVPTFNEEPCFLLGSCGGSRYLFWGVLTWGLALEIGQGACLKDDEIFPPSPPSPLPGSLLLVKLIIRWDF